MKFENILGHSVLKEKLIDTINNSRISHSQLFLGPEGNGGLSLALAYAQMILCDDPTPNDSCGVCTPCKQVTSFNYPDVHFVYPISRPKGGPTEPISINFINEWKDLVQSEQYFGLFQWLDKIEGSSTQATIRVKESSEISHTLSLKSYSGKEKILILWLPEKLNVKAANKLLKLIEEPPQGTVFLLVSEDSESILKTILSRCQKVYIPKYPLAQTEKFLVEAYQVTQSSAKVISKLANGNLARAIALTKRSDLYNEYAEHFVNWVRHGYSANIKGLFEWAELCAKFEKEKLFDFLSFCGSTFENSLQIKFANTEVDNSIFREINFELDKFAKVLNLKNLPRITKDLDQAIYYITRNSNPKLVLSDLSLNMARHLRVKD